MNQDELTQLMDLVEKSYRAGLANAFYKAAYPSLVFNPGLGMAPMEFKAGSVKALEEKLKKFVEGT